MDGNKDEADRCIQIALRCIQTGEREKARKFLGKAERLFPTEKAKELLSRISNTSNGSAAGPEDDETPSAAGAAGGQEDGGTRYRGKSTATGASGATDHHTQDTSPPEKSYTTDMLSLVRKIIKCKDYYEILGVAKDCVEDDLKKAYRKLALKLHPDKNHAPGATEAFKAVGKAFSVLNDPEKRRRYDVYGSEAERATSHRHSRHSHNGGQHYEFDAEDISAEEIFNMFFGGGFPTNNVRTRRMYTNRETHFTNQQHHNQTDNTYGFLLQLSPILFMILLSLLSSLLVADPTFSISRDSKYNTERYTSNLRIPYYVKSDFHTEYKGSMRRLEQQVEEEYIGNLRSNCFKERSYKENMLWRARNFGDGKLYEKAQNLKTPSCDRLQSIYA